MTRRNSWPVTGTYSGEELSATFTATMQRDSDGHAGVPNGIREFDSLDLGSIECETVEILGKPYPFKDLPTDLQSAVIELSGEVEWQ